MANSLNSEVFALCRDWIFHTHDHVLTRLRVGHQTLISSGLIPRSLLPLIKTAAIAGAVE